MKQKNLNDVNILLKIFGVSKIINQDVKVELNNLPKNLLRTSKYLNSSCF